MNILYLCHDGGLYGSQQSLLLILKNLPSPPFKLFVSVARPGPLTEALRCIPGVTVLGHRRLQWVKHDIRCYTHRIGDIIGFFFSGPLKIWALCRYIQCHQIQLVHTNSMVSPEGAIAAKLCGIPHVWHIRELFMEETPKLQPIFGKKITRSFIHHFSQKVLCISKAVQHQFEPFLSQQPDKYPVLYNALEKTTTEPKDTELNECKFSSHSLSRELPPKSGYRLGYIGRLSTGKRFQDLLEALDLLIQENGLSVDLIVAGEFVDKPFETLIKQRLENSPLQAQVHFLGYQTHLNEFYQSIDLLLSPVNQKSGNGGNHHNHNNNNSQNFVMKKHWMCITDGKL
ncbi:MAG: glycosyltransferase, partial [Cyanobacteria bacterium]|nr:glycosyltransferase [Cyanobacteriota bacterium]